MNKEELLKEIMKIPKAETYNSISTMNSINVDDLMNAVDRLNKVPDYNDLLKENQELKKQLENTITSYTEEHNLRHNSDLKLDVLETQQKEFIKYLEEKEKQFDGADPRLAGACSGILQKYKSIIEVSDEKK